jgi:uncharacterized protein (TIGR03435 family)
VAHTNAPGLEIYDATLPPSGGSTGNGKINYGVTTVDSLLGFAEDCFGRTVVDETGLTNRYNIRLEWKLSQQELGTAAIECPTWNVPCGTARRVSSDIQTAGPGQLFCGLSQLNSWRFGASDPKANFFPPLL